MRTPSVLVAALLAAVLALPPAAAQWGQERGGPGHTGSAGWDDGGTGLPVWRHQAFPWFRGAPDGTRFDAEGSSIAPDRAWPPALGDGLLVVLASRTAPRGGAVLASTLHAFDAATGDARWSAPVAGTPAQAPLIDGGTVAVPLADGRLARVALADGATLADVAGVTAPVSLRNGTAYFGDGSEVVAMSLQADGRGQVLWRASWPGEVPALAPADPVLSGAGPAVLADQVVVATQVQGAEYGFLHRLDPATGLDLAPAAQLDRVPGAASARADGLAAVGSHSVQTRGGPGPVCIEVGADGRCRHSCGHGPEDRVMGASSLYGPVAIDGAAVLAWGQDAHVVPLSEVPPICTAMAQAQSGAVAGDAGDRGHSVDASHLLAPALGQSAMYVPGSFKGLQAIRHDGTTAWQLGWGFVPTSAVVVGNGLLYGVEGDGWLYALDVGAGGAQPASFSPGEPEACFCQLPLERGRRAHELIVWVDNEGWLPGTAEVTLRVDGADVERKDVPLLALGHGDALFTLEADRDDRIEACVAGRCVPAVWDDDGDGVDADDLRAGEDDGVVEVPVGAAAAPLALLAAAGWRRRAGRR